MKPMRTVLVDGYRTLHTYRLASGWYESAVSYEVRNWPHEPVQEWMPPRKHETEEEAIAFHKRYVSDDESRFWAEESGIDEEEDDSRDDEIAATAEAM